MVPSAFIVLQCFPLTPNGKVDRRALPAPVRLDRQSAHIAPHNQAELQLTNIWEKLLGIHPIGVDESFFELGGTSLLAARLALEIEKVFGKTLPLARLLESPTIERLAAVLSQEDWSASWSSLVTMQRGSNKPPLFCVHAVGGNILSYLYLLRHLEPDQPVYGLQARGLDGKQPPFRTIEEMAAHYVQEVRKVQPEGPYHFAGISFGGVVIYEMAQQLCARGQQVDLLALFDTTCPGHDATLRQRLMLHFNQFVRLGIRQKFVYLGQRCQRVLMKLFYKSYLNTGLELPTSLRNIDMINRQAVARYVPTVYPGRAQFFRASERPQWMPDRLSGWDALVAGGLEVIEVPGDHRTFHQDHAKGLAERLTQFLRRGNSTPRK
jgi:aspartate racemase